MNSIEKQYLVKRENLNEEHYFESILQEAYRMKLLTDSELENIQLQSIELLAKQTEFYTNGESSSVKVETAQSILQSVFYSIGLYLKSFPDTDMSIMALKQKKLSELYKQGKKLIERQINIAEQLLNAVRKNSIDTDNYAYDETIKTGIASFFSSYDADFAAHDTPAFIVYPLSTDKIDLAGIEYIYSYLQKLFLENQFCKKFDPHFINSVLRGYDEHYQDLLINIFERVLTNALGCILINKNVFKLNIEPSDRQCLQQKLEDLPEDKIISIFQRALVQLFAELDISDKLSQEYISAAVRVFLPKLKIALRNHHIESIFVSPKEDDTQSVIQFEDGKRLDDELFRKIADEIRECRFASDKIAIIQKEIHSIIDLVDILEGDCLFDDEFYEVFKLLNDMELALLLKRLPSYTEDLSFHFTEDENKWQSKFRSFWNKINSKRRNSIKKTAEKIELD